MKKFVSPLKIVTMLTLSSLLLGGCSLAYMVFFQREVDSVAQNGPLEAQLLNLDKNLPLLEQIELPAGIAHDSEQDRFFVTTDQPHSLIPQDEVHFYVLNSQLDTIEFQLSLKTDGDLEGVTHIGEGVAVAVSEPGTLIYLKNEGEHHFAEQKRVAIFDDSDHKLASLAYDSERHHLYTAEKEGPKFIHKMDREGKLLESFPLELADHLHSKRDFSLDDDYTIAGMTYAEGHLYMFSEAYSTIFKFSVETQKIESIIGINQLPEVSGITVKQKQLYFVGDYESYLPTPQIHVLSNL